MVSPSYACVSPDSAPFQRQYWVVDFLQRIPLLLITAILLIGGVFENDIGSGSQAMLAVGFVSFGAWLTVEIQSWHQRLRLQWEVKAASQVNTAIVPLEEFFEQKDPEPEKRTEPLRTKGWTA